MIECSLLATLLYPAAAVFVSEEQTGLVSLATQDPCHDLPSLADASRSWDDGWNGCDAYEQDISWCDSFGGTDFGRVGTAKQHCCVCGGGKRGASLLESTDSVARSLLPSWFARDCVDLPDGLVGGSWTDGWNGCEAYAKDSSWCSTYGNKDFRGSGSAKEKCCACGGGSSRNLTLLQVNSAIAGTCEDLPSAKDGTSIWNDGWNGCDAYANDVSWCGRFGSKDFNGAGSANLQCCACGGGRRTPASQSMTVALTEFSSTSVDSQKLCRDLPSKIDGESAWNDGSNGCSAYVDNSKFCEKYGSVDFTGAGRALDACCACGGGSRPANSLAQIGEVCRDLPTKIDGVSEWFDGWNGCDAYASNSEFCDVFGSIDFQGAGKASDSCCTCGGGTRTRSSRTSTPASFAEHTNSAEKASSNFNISKQNTSDTAITHASTPYLKAGISQHAANRSKHIIGRVVNISKPMQRQRKVLQNVSIPLKSQRKGKKVLQRGFQANVAEHATLLSKDGGNSSKLKAIKLIAPSMKAKNPTTARSPAISRSHAESKLKYLWIYGDYEDYGIEKKPTGVAMKIEDDYKSGNYYAEYVQR
eukprot:TRINITY_DN17285_c0_g1_i1.p1 TRINITY_DN17285_c0_g1~~TRINITY_DN17285_c0_g1_i1.p1  ORF type:complete len:586 (+),score=90.22 TRINITY_DN17285_c0_g1_i1:65-1822(+)